MPRRPAEVNVDVAVPPNNAVLAERMFVNSVVPVALVKVRPPLKFKSVVVAFEGKRYPKFA